MIYTGTDVLHDHCKVPVRLIHPTLTVTTSPDLSWSHFLVFNAVVVQHDHLGIPIQEYYTLYVYVPYFIFFLHYNISLCIAFMYVPMHVF